MLDLLNLFLTVFVLRGILGPLPGQLQLGCQFKFLLLFALHLFNVLRKVWPVELVVQPLLDLQHFFGNATKGLRYLMDQVPVVVEVIMGPHPQVGLMSFVKELIRLS